MKESSIEVDGKLIGYGTVTGDNGTLLTSLITELIEASSSHSLYLNANITGTGVLRLTNNTAIELGGSVSSTLSVVFAIGGGATGKLILDDPADFHASISGFGGTDVIDLRAMTYSSTQTTVLSGNYPTATVGAMTISLSIRPTETIITMSEGATVATIKLEGNYAGHSFAFSSDGSGGTQFVDPLAIDSGATLELFGASTDSVSFVNNAGTTGMLVLDTPTAYTGLIFGYTGTSPQQSDLIDLLGIAFDAGTSWTYSDNAGSDTGGLLTIYGTANGVTTQVNSITFANGDYTTANFILKADGHGGTLVAGSPISTTSNTTAASLSNVADTTLTASADIVTLVGDKHQVLGTDTTVNNGDTISGGTGTDTLIVDSGDGDRAYTFGDGGHADVGLTHFDNLILTDVNAASDHAITAIFDSNFQNDGSFTVDGSALTHLNGTNLTVDAHLAPSGSFVFIGTESADTLIGSSNGNNIISGGGGGDRLTGGGSSDTFVFKAVTNSMPGSFDTIANFDHGADHIDLTAISGADSNFNSLTATPTSIAAHTIDIVATGGNTVIYVNASGSAQTIGSSDMEIHLTNVTNVTSADFLIIH